MLGQFESPANRAEALIGALARASEPPRSDAEFTLEMVDAFFPPRLRRPLPDLAFVGCDTPTEPTKPVPPTTPPVSEGKLEPGKPAGKGKMEPTPAPAPEKPAETPAPTPAPEKPAEPK